LPDEVHFFYVTLVADDALARGRDAAVHLDDQLVGESTLTLLKEVVEGSLELFEDAGVLNQVGLHFWGDLLVELELLDNEVEIVKESLLDVFADIVVERWLDVERLVRLFNLLDPHVEGVELLLNEVVEVVRGVEDTVN
jgi:hypothetical protein